MAYSNFTLEMVRTAFQLEIVESADIFSQASTVALRERFTDELAERVELAISSGTEKARSELIVANVLFELRKYFDHRISFFSGIEFSVDTKQGLTGICDFLVSLSPLLSFLEAPVIILVEAKRENLIVGLGQCAAEMIAAQRFNAERGNNIPCTYGATTSGTDWRFLKLEGERLHIDRVVYHISQCDKILGILSSMVEQKV